MADAKEVLILIDGRIVRSGISLDVTRSTWPAVFVRVSRELLVPLAHLTAVEALPCARGATLHRVLAIKGLTVGNAKTLTLVAHRNLKDGVGANGPVMAETRKQIKIRDRFVGERVSVARAQIRAVMDALARPRGRDGAQTKKLLRN